MPLVQGNFNFKLGLTTLSEIDDFKFNYDVSTDDHESLQGHTYEIEGAHKVSVEARFLESDVPSLAVALPQYYVANGEALSTGETVTDTQGAIDVRPSQCGDSEDLTDLIVTACGTNAQVLRVLQVKSRIGGVELDGNVLKTTVVFTGFSDDATIQMFRENAIALVS